MFIEMILFIEINVMAGPLKKCLKKHMIAVHLSKYDYKSKPKQNPPRKHKKCLNRGWRQLLLFVDMVGGGV